jgi:hypothetical protein
MLDRARKLQRLFDQYCTTHQYVQFQLDQEEWRQVDYLLPITKPFFGATNILSKTQDVSVHHVFSIYNRMFTHLEEAEEKLIQGPRLFLGKSECSGHFKARRRSC